MSTPFHRTGDRTFDRVGVTLIETIMMVMLLASATIAGSFMLDGQWLSRRGATEATNHVHETLTMARNTAIADHADVHLRHDRLGGHELLTIVEDAGPYSAGKKWQIDLGPAIQVNGSPTEIWFKASGSTDRGLEWKISDGVTSGVVMVTPTDGNVTRKLP